MLLSFSIYSIFSCGTVSAEEVNGSSSGKRLYETLKELYGDSSSESSHESGSESEGSSVNDDFSSRETSVKGPSVADISLSEQYHENYRVYEESLNDDISFFTNVQNGTMTNKAVIFDIPEGVAAVLKKDGSRVSIESEVPITEEGSYVLTLYVQDEDEDSRPFSEQEVSKAKFRFRIQYSPGVAGYDAITEAPDFSGSVSEDESLSSDEINTAIFGDGDGSGYETDDSLPDDLKDDDLDYFAESVENIRSGGTEENSVENADADRFISVNGMTGEYDAASGFYLNRLSGGEEFYTSAPNGMLTNDAVMIQGSEELQFILYKDGEAVEDFEPGQYLTDEGSYTLFAAGKDSASVSVNTQDMARFHFRIFKSPVNDARVLNAPEGMTFRTVRYEGEDLSSRTIKTDTMLYLENDGTYEITMDSDTGSSEFTVILDSIQPFFSVQTEPNHAVISYLTDDAYSCELYRGDELIQSGDLIREISDAGNYNLIVYDQAGNKASYAFSIRYRINAAAVIAIIVLAGLLTALVLYIRRIRKKVSVR